jgi:hypothetical protein
MAHHEVGSFFYGEGCLGFTWDFIISLKGKFPSDKSAHFYIDMKKIIYIRTSSEFIKRKVKVPQQ